MNVPPISPNETTPYWRDESVNSDWDTTVSSLYSLFCDTTFANVGLGWCLFVAAMTPNGDVRSDLIRSVHDRALLYGNQGIGAFPVRYLSESGLDRSGIGR
jgi:hypothetical protein